MREKNAFGANRSKKHAVAGESGSSSAAELKSFAIRDQDCLPREANVASRKNEMFEHRRR